MKKILWIISLLALLTGCDEFDRNDIFGYESYSHCMLKVISTQPTVDNDIRIHAQTYCKEKFPEKDSEIIVRDDLPELKELDPNLTADRRAELKELFPYMTPEERRYFIALSNLTDEEIWQRVEELRAARKELRAEVDKRISKGVWSIPLKEPKDMTDEELLQSLDDTMFIRKESDEEFINRMNQEDGVNKDDESKEELIKRLNQKSSEL